MVRYPHTLAVSWQTDGGFNDDTGNYEPGESETLTIGGRAEANGKGNLIRTEDGAQIVYDWTFYFEPIEKEIPFGAEATLTHDTGVYKGTVKRADVAQVSARLWL